MSGKENDEIVQVNEEEALFARMKALVEKEVEELPHSNSRRGFLQSALAAVALPIAALVRTPNVSAFAVTFGIC